MKDKEIYDEICSHLKAINPEYTVETMVDRNFISGKVYGWDEKEVKENADRNKDK